MAHLESVTTQKNISVKCKILLKNILSFLDKIFKIYVETTHCKCGVFLPKWDNKPSTKFDFNLHVHNILIPNSRVSLKKLVQITC
ncbi:hypothetical protein [Candidatus Tisiphia endosymbiont of Parasteatoda lunata]|uniref:hypothetical protein n=1 Tax=Candidatus Tisiphia endosymbiont of Parasteatoda lunata TaxID=3066275 RepID=UPI00313D58B0